MELIWRIVDLPAIAMLSKEPPPDPEPLPGTDPDVSLPGNPDRDPESEPDPDVVPTLPDAEPELLPA
jgi:hypothetical protein